MRRPIGAYLSRDLLQVLVIYFLEENGTTLPKQHLEEGSDFEAGMGETRRHEAI